MVWLACIIMVKQKVVLIQMATFQPQMNHTLAIASLLTWNGSSIVQLTLCVCQRSGGVTGQVDHIMSWVIGATTRNIQILCENGPGRRVDKGC